MVWDQFREHLPTVAITATSGAIVAAYRGCNASLRSRRRPKILRLIAYSANSSLSGAIGAAIISAGMVHVMPSWPWMVIASGVMGGVAVDVGRANGMARLRALWLDYLDQVARIMRGR